VQHILSELLLVRRDRNMKAIRIHEFGPPEVMRIEEMPDLEPEPKQVVVRVRAAGVNPADIYRRSGAHSARSTLPYTPGMDAAGVVHSVGDQVTSISIGTRVYVTGSSGAYAEQMLCDESDVHMLPRHVSFAQGAAVNIPYCTAYRALFQRAHAMPGETVLIHGATGGVGIAALQLARAAGMSVIGTGGTKAGRELVIQQGAHRVLDHNAPAHIDQVLALTGDHGVEIVLEMLANVNLGSDLKVLAPGGRVIVIGSRGKVEVDPRDILRREAAVLGVYVFNTSQREKTSTHSALVAGLENLTLRPVVGKEIPLADAALAHHTLMEPGAYGKIVLIP
jgi:NADPH2:quinone reductase